MRAKTASAKWHRRLSIPMLFLAVFLTFAWTQKADATTCSATVAHIDFGAPNLLTNGATDALATVTITCTGLPILTAIKMCPSIDDGSGGSDASARLMSGPDSAKLEYQLYQDSSRTLAWGAVDNPHLGTVPPITLNGSLTGAATATHTIYARLFGGQTNAAPGNYDSAFAGAETSFTYTTYFLSASGTCAGFVGTAVIHPEFDVAATPAAGCSLATTDLTFPVAGVLANAITSQTSINVVCTSKTAYSIALDNGRAGTSPGTRKMASSTGDTVTYALYRDSARTLLWGGASGQLAAGTGSGAPQNFTIYGLVPAQSTPKPATYSDRIIATLTY